ncbi:hypothetical protein B0H10DRAFT_1967071 [Mycena sp. CBHHK59/15]|nr:hypothetical protein B0H10DRAFT_1967071 [Mycena sp. CBHHK59/15]
MTSTRSTGGASSSKASKTSVGRHSSKFMHVSSKASGSVHISAMQSTNSSGQMTAAMTSVHFNTNPVAPIGASVETLVGPGTTKVISIPSATTVILLGSPVPSTTISRSTNVLSGSRTVIHTVSSTTTHVVGVTLGPGGEVVGSVPASVSQPGFVPPVFNSNPVPLPGATQLTFTGTAGYSTTVPVPTSSSSTILIGAIFGGGSIVLGAGGTIIGTLPAGIGEVGGVYPVLIPPPQDDPPHQPTLSTSTPSPSASSSKCPRPTVITCGSVCDSDNPDQYFYASDADEDDEAPARRWTSLVQIAGCIDNSKLGLTYPKLGSSADGTFFFFWLDNKNKPILGQILGWKPRFELWGTMVKTLVISPFSTDLVHGKQNMPRRWEMTPYVLSKYHEIFDAAVLWGDSAARAKLEFTMRGFDLNMNANAFRNTAQDIMVLLQTYERRTGTAFNPPMAVQFYDFYVSEMSDYTGRGKHLGTYLAERYNAKMSTAPERCVWINMPAMLVSMRTNYPTRAATCLISPRPLCFPDGSAGKVVFRPPNTPNHPGMELNSGMTIMDATASGTNVKVNLHVQAPNSQGWNYTVIYTPTELTDTSCQGVYLQACMVQKGLGGIMLEAQTSWKPEAA